MLEMFCFCSGMTQADSPAPDPDPAIDPTDLDALAGGDPEIRALLDFTPVPRKTKRHDGWPPELQRAFIAMLARIGNYRRAAQALGRSGGGAESLRKSIDAESSPRPGRRQWRSFISAICSR